MTPQAATKTCLLLRDVEWVVGVVYRNATIKQAKQQDDMSDEEEGKRFGGTYFSELIACTEDDSLVTKART